MDWLELNIQQNLMQGTTIFFLHLKTLRRSHSGFMALEMMQLDYYPRQVYYRYLMVDSTSSKSSESHSSYLPKFGSLLQLENNFNLSSRVPK